MKIFVLDDCLDRHESIDKWFAKEHEVFHAVTTKEGKELIQNHVFTTLFLDHDLNEYDQEGREVTGYDFCRWLSDQSINRDIQIIIHSVNPIGADNMKCYLIQNGFTNVVCIPFTSLMLKYEFEY